MFGSFPAVVMIQGRIAFLATTELSQSSLKKERRSRQCWTGYFGPHQRFIAVFISAKMNCTERGKHTLCAEVCSHLRRVVIGLEEKWRPIGYYLIRFEDMPNLI